MPQPIMNTIHFIPFHFI